MTEKTFMNESNLTLGQQEDYKYFLLCGNKLQSLIFLRTPCNPLKHPCNPGWEPLVYNRTRQKSKRAFVTK